MFRRKMNKSQAFWGGFLSVFEVRSFGEKPTFHPNGKPFDYKKVREELGYDENVWDRVGKTLRKAMTQYENEVGIDKIEATK